MNDNESATTWFGQTWLRLCAATRCGCATPARAGMGLPMMSSAEADLHAANQHRISSEALQAAVARVAEMTNREARRQKNEAVAAAELRESEAAAAAQEALLAAAEAAAAATAARVKASVGTQSLCTLFDLLVIKSSQDIERDITMGVPRQNMELGAKLGARLDGKVGKGEGCEVLDVTPCMPFAVAGLQVGDILLSVNGLAFDDYRDAEKALRKISGLGKLKVFRRPYGSRQPASPSLSPSKPALPGEASTLEEATLASSRSEISSWDTQLSRAPSELGRSTTTPSSLPHTAIGFYV